MSINKPVVVSGANSELARTVISVLAGKGVPVLATTRTRVPTALAELSGVNVLDGIDLMDPAALDRLQKEARAWNSGFHIVHCVGYFPGFHPIHRLDAVGAKHTYEANLVTTYNLASTLVPIMASGGGGDFVSFSSHAIPPAFPMMAAFLSAKAGVEFLSRAIANEFGGYGVRATTFALGTVDTPQERVLLPGGEPREWLSPLEVANHIVATLKGDSGISNGNVIHLYKHSDNYSLETYLDRIGRRHEWPVRL